MIEHALFAALGALVAGLLALVVLPAFSRRAARLTTRHLVGQLPLTLDEIAAERDGIRAAAAAAQRRLEQRVETADLRHAADAGELGRRAATIVGLQGERTVLTSQRDALKTALAAVERDAHEARAEAGTMQQGFYGFDALLDGRTSAWAIREREHADLAQLSAEQKGHLEMYEARTTYLEATTAAQAEDLVARDAWAAEQAITLASTQAARVAALMRAETAEQQAAEAEHAHAGQQAEIEGRLAERERDLGEWAAHAGDLKATLASTETDRDEARTRAETADMLRTALESALAETSVARDAAQARADAAEATAAQQATALTAQETSQRDAEAMATRLQSERDAATRAVAELEERLAQAAGHVDDHETTVLQNTADWRLRAAALAEELAVLEHRVSAQADAITALETARDQALERALKAEQRADEADQAKLRTVAELAGASAGADDEVLRATIATIGAEVVRLAGALGDAALPPSTLATQLDRGGRKAARR